MTLEIWESGAIPKMVPGRQIPHVRDKEDVPHEHSIPDLYGVSKLKGRSILRRGATLSEFLNSVEAERRYRAALIDLISASTDMQCREIDDAFGLLIIFTRAKPLGAPRYIVEYCDVIISDRIGDEGYARLLLVQEHAAAAGAIDLEHERFDRPHPQLDGSSSFKIIRYGRRLIEYRDATEKCQPGRSV